MDGPPGAGPDRRLPVVLALLSAVALSVVLSTGGCGPRFDPTRPDVVLVVIDTLRADHLGAYGYARDTSPRLDGLARRAALFERAWSAAPWTLPSLMSIMTSRYPSSHRVENDGLRLGDDVPTLAETLRARGYATGGFVSHIYATAAFGFDRGFDRFEDFGLGRPGYRLEAGLEPTADRVTAAAADWLRQQGARPVFLLVHYFDPHWPYDPPAAYRDLFPSSYGGPLDAGHDAISRFNDPLLPIPDDYRRFLIDRYDGEIRFTDAQVGALLDAVGAAGRAARAWVVLTADHGEEFKDHGSMGHGRELYEEAIRVPLLIARPPAAGKGAAAAGDRAGAPAAGGARVGIPVSGIDLFPTILQIAGAPAPAGLQGRSLLPLLDGGGPSPAEDRSLVSETVRLDAYRKAVRRGALKLIQYMDRNRVALYDLAADPGEKVDVAARRPEERRRLMQALFSEVDLLSGGWNLRWEAGGRPHRFQGQLRTQGIFRTVVPLFEDAGEYRIERGDMLSFSDIGQRGAGGLSFTTAPADAPVTFYLTIDGRPRIEAVALGGQGARPRVLPFTLEGTPQSELAFERPGADPGAAPRFMLWRNRPPGPDQEIILDDEIRERLRSLGYVN